MRIALILAGNLVILGLAAKQTDFPAPLARHFDKLKSAPGLTVEYRFRPIGDTSTDYRLELAKPNLFKLTKGDDFFLSDGTKLYTYTKAGNTYTEEALTDDVLATFLKRPEMFGWGAYLAKTPGSDIAVAKVGATHTVVGNDVTDVSLALKSGGITATLFIDKKLDVARGFDLKVGTKEYIATASKIELSSDAVLASRFAFNAPDGAKKTEPVKATDATYAQVQAIMNANCLPCHDAANQSGGLDLTNYPGIMGAVKPGDGANSALVQSLRAAGRNRMPRGRGPLPEAQIKLIQTWIDNGAKKA